MSATISNRPDFKYGQLYYRIIDQALSTIEVFGTRNQHIDFLQTYYYAHLAPATMETIDIPSTVPYEGRLYTVVGISKLAFQHHPVHRVTLPDTLEYIDAQAFQACCQLTEIVIPRGLKRIGQYAFGGCRSLQYIEWNAIACAHCPANAMPFYANDAPDLPHRVIRIGSEVETMPNFLFSHIQQATSVEISAGVRNMNVSVFFPLAGDRNVCRRSG